jgi:hypothetical protein
MGIMSKRLRTIITIGLVLIMVTGVCLWYYVVKYKSEASINFNTNWPTSPSIIHNSYKPYDMVASGTSCGPSLLNTDYTGHAYIPSIDKGLQTSFTAAQSKLDSDYPQVGDSMKSAITSVINQDTANKIVAAITDPNIRLDSDDNPDYAGVTSDVVFAAGNSQFQTVGDQLVNTTKSAIQGSIPSTTSGISATSLGVKYDLSSSLYDCLKGDKVNALLNNNYNVTLGQSSSYKINGWTVSLRTDPLFQYRVLNDLSISIQPDLFKLLQGSVIPVPGWKGVYIADGNPSFKVSNIYVSVANNAYIGRSIAFDVTVSKSLIIQSRINALLKGAYIQTVPITW